MTKYNDENSINGITGIGAERKTTSPSPAFSDDSPVGNVDMVNHPPHYKNHKSGIECIEVTRWMGFNLGNAFKYLYRRHDKGEFLQNLEKAYWYLCDEGNRTGPVKVTFENHYDYQRYFLNIAKIVEAEPELQFKEIFFNIAYAQMSDNPQMFLGEAAKLISTIIEFHKKENHV